MSEPIAFLQQKAGEIRTFASVAPEMARELRELAGLIEETAEDIGKRLHKGPAQG